MSVGARLIQEYFKKKRGGKRKSIRPQQDKARHEEWMKRGKVIFLENLFVDYWELIPMESEAELSAPQDTTTVRVADDRRAAKKQRNYWWTGSNWPRLKEALVNSWYPSLIGHCVRSVKMYSTIDHAISQYFLCTLQHSHARSAGAVGNCGLGHVFLRSWFARWFHV